MVSLNFNTDISPLGTFMVDSTEKLSKSDGIMKSWAGARAAGTAAGVAVVLDLVPHLGAAVAKALIKTGCKIVEFVPNLFGKNLDLTPGHCTFSEAGVHVLKAARNIPCGIALIGIGVAPSLTAVVSRKFGTSHTPVPPKPQGRIARAKDAVVGGAKACGNAVMHPLDTGSKAIGVVRRNPKASIAVATVALGLVAGQYFGLNKIAFDYASEKGQPYYEQAKGIVSEQYTSLSTLAGSAYTSSKTWAVATASTAYEAIRCRIWADCPADGAQ